MLFRSGTVASPSLKECFAMGYDFVSGGADVVAIGQSCKKVLEAFAEVEK